MYDPIEILLDAYKACRKEHKHLWDVHDYAANAVSSILFRQGYEEYPSHDTTVDNVSSVAELCKSLDRRRTKHA